MIGLATVDLNSILVTCVWGLFEIEESDEILSCLLYGGDNDRQIAFEQISDSSRIGLFYFILVLKSLGWNPHNVSKSGNCEFEVVI